MAIGNFNLVVKNKNRKNGKTIDSRRVGCPIQEYLTDGVLTPKEREVILKKAEKMRLDRDEIDLYLDCNQQTYHLLT